ncbi:MAG: DUF1653 domain-containing protein [Oleibacter sp.]|nr:DUF1653 domain-containing protein [Thalassolituus sp.]
MTDNASPSIRVGRYRHYKGAEYEVFGLVRHSETEEWLVYYRTLYGDYSHWVRPFSMFTEMVDIKQANNGNKITTVPRFEWIAEH